MQKKALILALVGVSVSAVGASTEGPVRMAPRPNMPVKAPAPAAAAVATQAPGPSVATVVAAVQQPFAYSSPAPSYGIAADIARWNSLRQSDNHPFSSYASFLLNHRGWPGETAMRRNAERQADPSTTPAGELIRYFSAFPPLTPTGHARHALALLATGQPDQARLAAQRAWQGGVLQPTDENRILGAFGNSLTQQDHDIRADSLLSNGDTQGAARIMPMTSFARRPVLNARLAMRSRALDAESHVAAAGSTAFSDAGFIIDRANWLRNSGQPQAARDILARPMSLTHRPQDAEKWLDSLLTIAQAAANDRQYSLAYQIASQADQAFPAGTRVVDRSTGERDKYTSLVWLAGRTALHQLGRPSDAANMFQRYARAGRSLQVLTKGLYWAGRASASAGQAAQANSAFEEAARYPELFYSQLALERLGRPVPAPSFAPAPTLPERASFQSRSLVQAVRHLGQTGSWSDQSLFVRALGEAVKTDGERVLATELGQQIGRSDLGVWVARSARNAGSTFYVRGAYPEVSIPPGQSRYWSLAHGIIRQESSFDRAAVSHAGARGMMQLMPATAREVAGKNGLGYSMDRLTQDPSYNITLGSSYMGTLMDRWGGNAALVAASYNAGGGNVNRWVRENGDPRMPGTDILKWIEDIPFTETRGYVQRVLENAVVYDTMHPVRAASPPNNRISWYLGKSGRPG